NPVTRAVRLRLFPPAPALSRELRGNPATAHSVARRSLRETVRKLFPLAGGEGQGEGEQGVFLARKLLLEAGPTIEDFSRLPVADAYELFRHLKFKGHEARIARDILPEIRERLK